MTAVFGVILLVGLVYLFLMILGGIGSSLDFGVDGALESIGLDSVFGMTSGGGDASGLGCAILSVFFAMFGAVGVVGSLAGWNIAVILFLSTLIGWMIARVAVAVMKPLVGQDSTDLFSKKSLVGKIARVTIESPAGKTGEVMIEAGQIYKYPVKEVNGEALHRSDRVEILEINGRILIVRRIQD